MIARCVSKMPMILSNTINIKYKYATCGMNTKQMAQLLKYYGLRGYLKYVNINSFIMAVLPEDKEHNKMIMDELKEWLPVNDYKLNMNKHTIDDQPILWTHAEYKVALQILTSKYMELKRERDTLIDDIVVIRANNDRLKQENKRLNGLADKLIAHRKMWDDLKDWRMEELVKHKDNYQLIELGLVMDKLEKRYLYK